MDLKSSANLDVSVQGAGAAAVGDAAGLLVYGSEARRRRGRALRVALHARQQDAAQRGLSGRMQHQLRGEACKDGDANTLIPTQSSRSQKQLELLEVVTAGEQDLSFPPGSYSLF